MRGDYQVRFCERLGVNKYWTIKGMIKIENKRASITKYCNGLTRLKINNKLIARCYVDTYASMIIDYGLIDLKPNEMSIVRNTHLLKEGLNIGKYEAQLCFRLLRAKRNKMFPKLSQ
jgi:hypothetical protein